jgi:putative peptide zinc metalloprotease protein
MLCPHCRCQVGRDTAYCTSCGEPVGDVEEPLELVLADGTRLPLVETMTIGRGPGNAVRLDDASVSRTHARIIIEDSVRPMLEDAGSTYGTWLDGERVVSRERIRDGARLRVGDTELVVEARRSELDAGRTVVIRPGASVVVRGVGRVEDSSTTATYGVRPRVRSGWALKRLDVDEGDLRYVLRDLRRGRFLRMDDVDAGLFELLDGSRQLVELVGEAEARLGDQGTPRLARLLADLGERGLLEGVDTDEQPAAARGRLVRLLRPRERAFEGAGGWFERLYRRGGYLLFTTPALVALALVAVAGVASFAYLVAGRYGTPLIVANRIGIGGLVFLAGRFLLVSAHEMAHGLVVASFGRRVARAGVKLLMIFPYAFVETSEAWFEPRRRRIAVSAAGPASDLVLGGAFAIASAAVPAGTVRDILFQVAFAGYVGALFNLNPLLDRDGYHILVDLLREPGLRRRSREDLARRLAGRATGEVRPALRRYALLSTAWLFFMAAFVIVLSLHYYDRFAGLGAPKAVVWAGFGLFYLILLVPLVATLGRPLVARFRASPEAGHGD